MKNIQQQALRIMVVAGLAAIGVVGVATLIAIAWRDIEPPVDDSPCIAQTATYKDGYNWVLVYSGFDNGLWIDGIDNASKLATLLWDIGYTPGQESYLTIDYLMFEQPAKGDSSRYGLHKVGSPYKHPISWSRNNDAPGRIEFENAETVTTVCEAIAATGYTDWPKCHPYQCAN